MPEGARQRLLFTGGGGAGSYAVYATLKDRHDCVFADADPSAFDPRLPEDARVVIPFANDPAFLPTIKALCERLSIDTLVPGVDEELSALARMQGEPGWPRIYLPDAGFVDLMLDKLASMRAIEAAGLPCPTAVPLAEADRLSFPLIAKPKSGRGSRGVAVLKRREQVEPYLVMQDRPADEFIAQALAKGDEYTVFVCADDTGALTAIVPVLVELKRGITIRARTTRCEPIEAYVRRFHAAFPTRCAYNLQCMLTPEGEVMPFEINPRVSTTFCLTLAEGFDPFVPHEGELFQPRGMRLGRHWNNTMAPVEPGA